MKKKEYKKKVINNKRNEINFDLKNKEDEMKIVKILLGVILFILIAFVITKIITGEWTLGKAKEEEQTPSINITKRLCGNFLEVTESSYYVIFYDSTTDDAGYYQILIDRYQTNKSLKNVYTVDLSDGLNKSCLGENSNITNNLSAFKVAGPTIIKVENKNITNSKMGKLEIKNYFDTIS